MAKIAVIGSGFSGLAAAAYLAKSGNEVTLFEKNESIGGRCRQFEAACFTFDMGPSWYWMPEVFEQFFQDFGHTASDFYELIRLDPSYKVWFADGTVESMPSDLNQLKALFEKIEPGSSKQLDRFLKDAHIKYEAGMNRFVNKPSVSLFEFVNWEIIKGSLKLDLFTSFTKHVHKYFKNPKLIELMQFPVLFLGATPREIPALYSLMNYADIVGGTWYPQGGMFEIIKAMEKVCLEQGVAIHTNSAINEMHVEGKKITKIAVNGNWQHFDKIIGSADYNHIDKELLPQSKSNYSDEYWDKRKMAPSSLLFYLGLDTQMPQLEHHNLFFDASFDKHAAEIYEQPKWPENPLFYCCAPSKTDPSVAPAGNENLFLLIPLAPDLEDSPEWREKMFEMLADRLLSHTGVDIRNHIVYKNSFAMNDFKKAYNAFKGNAYGLANTLSQTAFLKPSIRNKHIDNLFYTGQLTVPGPGVPPSIISGKVVAEYALKH